MYARGFLVLVLGFSVGVWYRSLFSFGSAFVGLFVLIALAVFAVGYFYPGNRRQLFFFALFFFSVAFGAGRYGLSSFREDKILGQYLESRVIIEGVVIDEPDERENHTNLYVRPEKIVSDEIALAGSPEILVVTGRFPEFRYGDRLHIDGELVLPKNFATDDREFDYVRYLAKEGVKYQMFRPEITVLDHGAGSSWRGTLFRIKEKFIGTLNLLLPEPESSLAGGLIVGAKQSLGKELLDKFRAVGVVHLVVLSGYNLSVVSDSLVKMFSFLLPRVAAFSLGIFGIILFTLMTGAGPATLRAAIMAIVAVIARQRGEPYQAANALVFAGFLMVLFNPAVLVFDTGFQLSFLATLGLIFLAPVLEKRVERIPKKVVFIPLRELFVTTVAAQIAVLPWLLYKIGDLSLVALPVNLLILGFIPLTMLLGFITGLVGFISTTVALPFAWVTHLLLAYELGVVDLFASVPLASVHVPYFSIAFVLIAYGGLAYLIWRNRVIFEERAD